MMNYVKSEIYRASRDKGIYIFTAILACLCILFNVILYWFGKMDETFLYNTTSHSYSNLVANPMLFCIMGALVAVLLYGGNKKNGNLKNTVSFGISRTKVFFGECMVAAVTAVISCIVVLSVHVVSVNLLLEQAGPVSLNDLWTEIPAVLLLAIASLMSGIICMEAFEKEIIGIIVYLAIWFTIPKIFFYLGLRIGVFHRIAMWMPNNFFGTSVMSVNMSESITAWETGAGMAKCIISGIIGILVFSAAGAAVLRKKEL